MSSSELEKRVAALEEELAKLKTRLDTDNGAQPWWQRIAGTFENDAAYKKASKLGQQYRRSQHSADAEEGK